MILSLVAAMAKNRTIGNDNKLIWHLPEDLAFFKTATKSKIMIMGRKTFDSLPKALPGRFHIVISRSTALPASSECVHFVNSVDQSITKAQQLVENGWPEEVCVIGGAEIYKLFLPLAHRIYLTELSKNFEGDTFFPEFDSKLFRIEILKQSKDGDIEMDFKLYHRK